MKKKSKKPLTKYEILQLAFDSHMVCVRYFLGVSREQPDPEKMADVTLALERALKPQKKR